MALIPCSECNREISDRAPACPHCGAPTGAPLPAGGSPITTTQVVSKKRTSKAAIVVLILLLGLGFWLYRSAAAPFSTGVVAALRQPRKLVSERISLKEGEAKMYSFTLPSNARIEVKAEATPQEVDVMLMTAEESQKFEKAAGNLFGGEYTYRQALSKQGVLAMNDTEFLPAGSWVIVVRRPKEAILFGDPTTASIDVTAY